MPLRANGKGVVIQDTHTQPVSGRQEREKRTFEPMPLPKSRAFPKQVYQGEF